MSAICALVFVLNRPSFILGHRPSPSHSSTSAALVSVPSAATSLSLSSSLRALVNPVGMRPASLPSLTRSRSAFSSTSDTGRPDGWESQGLRARSRLMIVALSSEAVIALLDVPTRMKYRPSAEYGPSTPEKATRTYALLSSEARRSMVGDMGGSILSETQPATWRMVASVTSWPTTSPLSLTPKYSSPPPCLLSMALMACKASLCSPVDFLNSTVSLSLPRFICGPPAFHLIA